jgi:hypothetical protein
VNHPKKEYNIHNKAKFLQDVLKEENVRTKTDVLIREVFKRDVRESSDAQEYQNPTGLHAM